MGQLDIITSAGATYCGIESAFQTTPTMIRTTAMKGSVDVSGFKVDQLPVMDERARGFSHIAPIHGFESTDSTIKLKTYFRPDTTQLVTGASVPVTDPGVFHMIKGMLGSTSASGYWAAAGSVIVSNTTSSVEVTAGHGATRFKKGTWIAVQTAAATLQYVYITNIATDTLSVWPNIPAGLTVGWIVVNGWTFAPQQNHSASMTIQHVKSLGSGAVTSAQWTANGCIGDMGVSWERGALPELSFDLKSASHTGPSAQSISAAHAAETMATVPAIVGSTTLLQAFSTVTSTSVSMRSCQLKLNGGMKFIRDYSGTQGMVGVIRDPQRPFCTGTIRMRFDPTIDTTEFVSQTLLNLVHIVPSGTGLTQRAVGFHVPNLVIVGKPSVSEDDGLLVTDLNFEALEDPNVTSGSADLDFAPVRFFAL